MLLWIIPSFVVETMTAESRRLKTTRTGQERKHANPGPENSTRPKSGRYQYEKELDTKDTDSVLGSISMLYTLAGGGTLSGIAALVLLVVSTATDYWMQYRYSGNFANQGLWRFCINNKCHAHTLTVAFWDATRAFTLLSVLSCFAGVVMGLRAFSNRTKNTRVRTAGIALLLSGFFALLALSIYTSMTVNFFGKRYIDWRFSWSYILCWLGTILTITAGILQICGYKRSIAEPAPQGPSIN